MMGRSKLGILACVLLAGAGCGDDGGGNADGGASQQAGAGGRSGGTQHLERDIVSTTSDSALIQFHCSLDYTVDIHGTPEQTEEWVGEHLENQAISVANRHPFVVIDMDDSLLSEEITMELTESVVGLPGIYGMSTFVATCGNAQLAM